MPNLNLKPTHKNVKAYYESLDQYERLGATHEGAVREAFQGLIKSCEKQFSWTLVPEHSISLGNNKRIVVDGALIDDFLTHGIWEAKDIHDDLEAEVQRKFNAGYPDDNILFQTPQRAILWQNASPVIDADLTNQTQLIEALEAFFSYRPPAVDEWKAAVSQFKNQVPSIGRGLATLIQKERKENSRFIAAFGEFFEKCRTSINPNLSESAVEEMLIQHLLTERIFRTVFNNSDFTRRNVIANEIEKVVDALTSKSFNRRDFLQSLDRFYIAIEKTAETIDDFTQKQHFLNTVYEQFFQGFSVEVADTHGIVYTPQPIVEFMVRSVEYLLRTRFNLSLSNSGVNIIDPFVGTGNFIVRVMQEVRKTALEEKYAKELHSNEVMLLPYYIASMNIEHEFYEATGRYLSYEGLCLVDSFELAEDHQLLLFSAENAARVELQKKANMFVVLGNPPYNAWQVNENDNNKNRKYRTLDQRVRNTYSIDSQATNKNALADPYVKAIRWASDRIGDKGIISFVTNNGFLGGVAFDGMRKHLAHDFDAIYIVDLGGNARKGLKVSDANVFGIRVGVSIIFLIKNGESNNQNKKPSITDLALAEDQTQTTQNIFYYHSDSMWRKKQKLDFLVERQHVGNMDWQVIKPDNRHTWLTEGLHDEFETFVPIGNKNTKAGKLKDAKTMFWTYSRGVATCRDSWVYNFNKDALYANVSKLIGNYNSEVDRWNRRGDSQQDVDDFVDRDEKVIKWSAGLKQKLAGGYISEVTESRIRNALYRPFTKSYLYFDRMMNERCYVFPTIFPTPKTEEENRVIIVSDRGYRSDFSTLMVNLVPDLHALATIDGFQCFPFFTYNEDGSSRQENITDWALVQFREHYQDKSISKWDIFYYTYGLLHHPEYAKRYEVNLKRDLAQMPFLSDFKAFALAGRKLAEIHIGYEKAEEHPLNIIENPDLPLDWTVKKMRLSKDRSRIYYNDFLTFEGVPSETFLYRLGNKSALEWIIDQYRLTKNARSHIINNPNRADNPQYITKLIMKVITVSLETLGIVKGLPDFEPTAHIGLDSRV